MSAFKHSGRAVFNMGHDPLPGMPPGEGGEKFAGSAGKVPGKYGYGGWYGFTGWTTQYLNRRANEAELQQWERWPGAGLCVLGHKGLVIFDADAECDLLLWVLRQTLPIPVVRKKGNRGETWFYRGTVTKQKLYEADGKVFEFPGHTVLPPSMHPKGMQYHYLTARECVTRSTH
jgi:hypothetical protein